MELPIENIQKVSWKEGKVIINFKDGNSMVGSANDVVLVSDYVNENDHPIVDHCI